MLGTRPQRTMTTCKGAGVDMVPGLVAGAESPHPHPLADPERDPGKPSIHCATIAPRASDNQRTQNPWHCMATGGRSAAAAANAARRRRTAGTEQGGNTGNRRQQQGGCSPQTATDTRGLTQPTAGPLVGQALARGRGAAGCRRLRYRQQAGAGRARSWCACTRAALTTPGISSPP